jgi:serine/threonine-protein kinase
VTADASWHRIKEIFQAAIERAPNDRSAFVEQACGEDQAVHQEVVSLLAAHHEAGAFAEQPAMETLADAAPGGVEYQLLSPLGSGGMGEVYRARDVALRRDVAIKILPPGFAADPERLARFEREAHVLASLSHPNICAIHGITDVNGTPGLVLELVDGPTLRERLEADRGSSRGKSRRIELKEALTIALDIARALEAAHEKGIIHRDLKPANIKIAPAGIVKVLDFGLAKVTAENVAGHGTAAGGFNLPCESRDGARLGTAAYMSPEQARGEPVDRRADIWAFGCVLYEMLTGRRAAPGDTVSETVAAVLESEPDWAAVPASVPPNIQRLVRRCLERDPKRRLKDIGDARLELEDALTPSSDVVASSDKRLDAWPSRGAWAWLLAAAIGTGAAAWLLSSRSDPMRTAPMPRRVSAELGTDASLVTFQFGQGAAAVLSPDGATLAFIGQPGDRATRQIYIRRLDELQAVPIGGTDGALNPFFSPDGQSIAFFADGKLKKVPTSGGGAVTICAVRSNRGGDWGADDVITFAPDRAGAALWQVPSSGGEPVSLTTLGENEITQRWPQMLQGGKAVLFTGNSQADGFDRANIVAQVLPNGPRKLLVQGAYYGRYLPSGHLIYVHNGTVFAAPFDVDRLELHGPAAQVLDGVAVNMPVGAAEIAFSDTGTVAYLPAPERVNYMDAPIDWLNRSGTTATMRATPARWLAPRFARDGQRLAFALFDGKQRDVWIYRWSRDELTRLTFDGAAAPLWTPDGARIVFQSPRGDGVVPNLYWQRVDGTGEPDRLTRASRVHTPGSWHPNGRILAFTENDTETGAPSIMMLRLDGDESSGWRPSEPTVFLENAADPLFSPDGRWLAYTAGSSPSTAEVFIRPFPGPGGRRQISVEGGTNPAWSSKRSELFFASPDNQIMVSAYAADGSSFHADKPQVLPNSRFTPLVIGRSFDLHPDGDRFALVKAPPVEARRTHVSLVFDFFEELRRIAPTGR